jgi:opacity protein-like surface antigen
MKRTAIAVAALCFCMLCSQNAMAQSHLGLRALGGEIGLVDPEGGSAVAGFGMLADFGTLAPKIRLTGVVDYWSHSEDGFGASASVGDLALKARGVYLFPVASTRVQPYAGLGLGLHFLSAKVEVPGFVTMSNSDTKLGLELGGGLEAPLGPRTSFIGEAWYGIVSDFDQLSFKVGLSYLIGR